MLWRWLLHDVQYQYLPSRAVQMVHIIHCMPKPEGPAQDAAVDGLHPDIVPLRLSTPDAQLTADMLGGADAAAAPGEAKASSVDASLHG